MTAPLLPIRELAARLGIDEHELYLHGPYMAKLEPALLQRLAERPPGKLVLVTATTPTPAGEGKTTTAVGLSMALNRLGARSLVTLREEIDLHFTGDIHAVTAATNLLASLIDNHLHHGNALELDPRRITWRRVLDMNDRALRSVVIGLGGRANGYAREDGFHISVASEVMAVLCLASDFADLKRRLARMVVGYTEQGAPVTAAQLGATGAMALLLKHAIKPNLVQTSEGTAALVHGGPFANIAHGTNSLQAIRLAQRLGEITVTEAGFASDLGGEKFLDFVAPTGGLDVDAIVVVTTLRALKHHGGAAAPAERNLEALVSGFANLDKHLDNMALFGPPVLVAVNRFGSDDAEELELVVQHCRRRGVTAALADPFGGGGAGCVALAEAVRGAVAGGATLRPLYRPDEPIPQKLDTIARRIYGASRVVFSRQARDDIAHLEKLGFGGLHVIVAKTPTSLSDTPELRGRPTGFEVYVDRVVVSAGAGFVVAICGSILLMPGLPRDPHAVHIDVSDTGVVSGLA